MSRAIPPGMLAHGFGLLLRTSGREKTNQRRQGEQPPGKLRARPTARSGPSFGVWAVAFVSRTLVRIGGRKVDEGA
jgi:hypothetical protein